MHTLFRIAEQQPKTVITLVRKKHPQSRPPKVHIGLIVWISPPQPHQRSAQYRSDLCQKDRGFQMISRFLLNGHQMTPFSPNKH